MLVTRNPILLAERELPDGVVDYGVLIVSRSACPRPALMGGRHVIRGESAMKRGGIFIGQQSRYFWAEQNRRVGPFRIFSSWVNGTSVMEKMPSSASERGGASAPGRAVCGSLKKEREV